MRGLLFLLLLISGSVIGQSTYYIRADSTRLEKVGGNNELILLNSTRDKTGAYLKNISNGRTGFFYAVDSAYISGSNLVLVRGGGSQNVTISGIGGSTPTFQQTLTAGSTLTGNNTVAMGGFDLGFTGGEIGIGTSSPSSLLNVQRNDIQTTQSDAYGIFLENSTAATTGIRQQYSPPFVLGGKSWRTSGGGASETHLWRNYVVPNTGGGTSSTWRLATSQAGGAYFDILTLLSAPTSVSNLSVFRYNSSEYGKINNVEVGIVGSSIYYGEKLPAALTGTQNVSIGISVLPALTSGSFNTGVGYGALLLNTSGATNTAIGANSFAANLTGYSNVGVGVNTGLVNTTGFQNFFGGAGAGEANTTGQENTFVGYDAGLNNTTGIRNFYGGWNAKGATDGLQNVAIGYAAGTSLTAGNSNNVFIGVDAGNNASQLGDADNTIAIGANSFTTADNQVVIGNSSMTQFNFWGALMPGGSAGTSGQVLTSAGAGTTPTWTTPGSTPTLQQVTDAGNLTTTDFGLDNGTNSVFLRDDGGSAILNITNSVSGNSFVANEGVFVWGQTIPSTKLQTISRRPTLNNNSTIYFPDSSGTVALLSNVAAASGITIGATTITSGTNTKILYNNSGVVGEYTVSGSGNVAMTTSPTFTTPNIGAATGTSLSTSANIIAGTNIGLGGSTPAAWAAGNALQKGNNSLFFGNGTDIHFNSNAYYDGAWKYASTGATAGVFMNAGDITMRTAASGSANAGLTWVERWTFQNAGHLVAATDNTYDIGASGATRPRTGYFGTSVITPALTVSGAAGTGTRIAVVDASGTLGTIPSYSVRVYNSGNISVPDATVVTITFDTERYDQGGLHSTVSNTGRLTAQADGVYNIGGNISFASQPGGIRLVRIILNGTTVIGSNLFDASTSDNTVVSVSTQYLLSAGDYVELQVYQSSGVTINALLAGNYSPEFFMTRLN